MKLLLLLQVWTVGIKMYVIILDLPSLENVTFSSFFFFCITEVVFFFSCFVISVGESAAVAPTQSWEGKY